MVLQAVQMFCAAKQTGQRNNNVDDSIKGGKLGGFSATLDMLFSFIPSIEHYLTSVFAALRAAKQ